MVGVRIAVIMQTIEVVAMEDMAALQVVVVWRLWRLFCVNGLGCGSEGGRLFWW